MSPSEEKVVTQPPGRRGQTFAEFALTLPILLLLMFGVIEFARIFQAWITLQNAARTAARYAITGDWNEYSVADALGYSIPGSLDEAGRKAAVLDVLVPCTGGADSAFTLHWDRDCEPGEDEDEGLRADMARIPSIVDQARMGAAGLSMANGDHFVGLHNAAGVELNSETVTENEKGWFHVWMCSTRPPVATEGIGANRYIPSPDRNDRLCNTLEGDTNRNQYDAGGPGDLLEIVIFFNHPLITPLGLVDYVQLQARRAMINESFRSTRVVNLPPQLAHSTYTPVNTAPPTFTPLPTGSPTYTFTPSQTPTNAPTETDTATPGPNCTLITLVGAQLQQNSLQIAVRNANQYAAVFITRVSLHWGKHTLYPDMYVDQMNKVGVSAFWRGTDREPDTLVDSTTPGWVNGSDPFDERRFDPGGTVTTVNIKFSNGPSDLSKFFTLGSFTGTTLYLGTAWGGVNYDCPVVLDGYIPPTKVLNPTNTPRPRCEDYEVQFGGFENMGVVKYYITNKGTAPAYLTGFNIVWNSLGRTLDPITLSLVSVGGSTAFDTTAVRVWTGSDNSSPATASSGGTGWLTNAVIEPGKSEKIWLDFDGAPGRLDHPDTGYAPYDFNGTTFVFNVTCNNQPPVIYTPEPTKPPTATKTPTITNTPTKTPTRGPTNTPTKTNTPGGPTKTHTPTPTKTNTPVSTPRPTDIFSGE